MTTIIKVTKKILTLSAILTSALLTGCVSGANSTASAVGFNTTNAMTGGINGALQGSTNTNEMAKNAALGAINAGFGVPTANGAAATNGTTTTP